MLIDQQVMARLGHLLLLNFNSIFNIISLVHWIFFLGFYYFQKLLGEEAAAED